jgi:hypothetical protein
MPTERALVGGGANYDNSSLSSNLQQYYNFSYFDSFSIYPYDKNSIATFNAGRRGTYQSGLFTGNLPYQNYADNCYLTFTGDVFYTYLVGNNSYYPALVMTFGLPVVLTKYRMWNGFKQNIICQFVGSPDNISGNIGYETPQSWTLYGSNDYITWTVVDSRSNQNVFPYATDRLCSNSPYVEYSISSPSAYKWYKLTIDKGSRTGVCYKSGCRYSNFQIGEVQLWGYEDPTTPCSLHGYDSLFPGVIYKNSANTPISASTSDGYGRYLSYNFSNAFGQTITGIYSNPTQPSTVRAWSGSPLFSSGGMNGYLDFGISVKVSSYKLKSAYWYKIYYYWSSSGRIAKNWILQASNDFSSWTTISTVTNAANNANYNSYDISNPSAYRYYKFSITNGYDNFSYKSGSGFYANIGDIQLVGTIA